MHRNVVLLVGFSLLMCGTVVGQPDPNYEVELPDLIANSGDATPVSVVLNFANGSDAAGFSFGVCHDPALADVECVGGIPNDCVDNGIIVEGAALAATNGGGGAGFFAPATTDTPEEGWTIGAVVNLLGADSLPAADGSEIVVTTYRVLAPTPPPGGPDTVIPLMFCETGAPLVILSIGLAGGGDVVPVSQNGSITVEAPPGGLCDTDFDFIAPDDAKFDYDVSSGTGSGDVIVQLDECDDAPTFPSDTQGFSYGLRHTEEVFIEDAGVPPASDRGIRPAPILEALNGGSGPDFYGPNANPANGPGHTVGVVYNLLGSELIQFADPTDIIIITYNSDPAVMAGDMDGADVPLTWANDLGNPPVSTTVVAVAFQVMNVGFVDGNLRLNPGGAADTAFIRGDSNQDLSVNIADGIWILNNLFQMGPDCTCAEACDADSNDAFDMSDAMFIINYRLLDGPLPAAPFPDCGIEAGADCASSACP